MIQSIGIKNNRALVAYHEDCTDGFTSAWVTHKALTRRGYEVGIIAMEYTEKSVKDLMSKLDLLKARGYMIGELFIVDFSLDIQALSDISSLFPAMRTTIIDHHKTAFERYAPQVEVNKHSAFNGMLFTATVILDNDESGASLCWRYFNPNATMPLLIRYVKDYDLWRFELGEKTKWVNKYIQGLDFTLEAWDQLNADLRKQVELDFIFAEGKRLQEAHDGKVEEIAKLAEPIVIDGIEGLYVPCEYKWVSDVGHILATKSGTFGAMCAFDTEAENTGVLKWSLRSNGDFDVSAIAKKLGGGGHKNAAGFTRQEASYDSDIKCIETGE